MGKIVYVTGGARSGKSSFAEKYVMETGLKRAYLATSIPFDREMKLRVEKHRQQRGEEWLTIEAYRDLAGILEGEIEGEKIILMDCLTNLVNNFMIDGKDYDWDNIAKEELHHLEKVIKEELEKLIEFIANKEIDLVVVSNEVGMGLVPPYALGRHFRDIAGRMNQLVAEKSEEAYLIVSGLPMKLK